MSFLCQHCLGDKGNGQNHLIKTKSGKKWEAQTHRCLSLVQPLRLNEAMYKSEYLEEEDENM